jgi:hypothetical protein
MPYAPLETLLNVSHTVGELSDFRVPVKPFKFA